MYILHYFPDTASLVMRIVLRELDVPFEERLIDRDNGELTSPGYLALHPLAKIPAMQTPDGPMFETAAMLLYLADRHGGLAPAPDSPDRAAFLKWLFFTSTNIHTTLMLMFYPDRITGAENTAAVVTHATAAMQDYLSVLDRMTAQDQPAFLSDKQPTILGYYVAMLIRWLASYGEGHTTYIRADDYPALHRVLAMLENRPAALAVAENEGLGPTIFTDPAY